MRLPLVSLLLCAILIVGRECKFHSTTFARNILIHELLLNYDHSAKPSKERIDVEVNIELISYDFRERDGAFQLVGILNMSWRDPKLHWDPIAFNNVTKIPVSQRAVWVPDLEVYNNIPDKFIRMHRNGMLTLDYTGILQWSDTIEVVAFCATDMHNWPRDRHECKLSLGSWTYDGLDLDISNENPNATMSFENTHNTEYRITDFTAMHVASVYDCCNETYIVIDYHIAFEGRATFLVIFRATAVAIIVLSLLAVSVEPWSGNKIWLNGVAMFLIVYHLIFFASKVGSFARGTPLIVRFYSYSFWLVTMGQCLTIFSLLATRSRIQHRMPKRILQFLRHPWMAYIASSKGRRRPPNCEADILISPTDESCDDWKYLAKVMERIALIIFACSYLLLGSICFV